MNKSITQATQNDKQISKSIKRFKISLYSSLSKTYYIGALLSRVYMS